MLNLQNAECYTSRQNYRLDSGAYAGHPKPSGRIRWGKCSHPSGSGAVPRWRSQRRPFQDHRWIRLQFDRASQCALFGFHNLPSLIWAAIPRSAWMNPDVVHRGMAIPASRLQFSYPLIDILFHGDTSLYFFEQFPHERIRPIRFGRFKAAFLIGNCLDLSFHEHVHHINGDYTDNRLENLCVLNAGDHMRHHHKKYDVPRGQRAYRKEYQSKYFAKIKNIKCTCVICYKEFYRHKYSTATTCSNVCGQALYRRRLETQA